MARLDKLPSRYIIDGFKGVIDFYLWKGIAVARRWPRYFARTPTPTEATNQQDFAYVNRTYSTLPVTIIDALKQHARGTTQTAKDYLVRAYLKGLFNIMPPFLPPHDHSALADGGHLSGAVIDTFLDFLEQAAAPANPAANYARLYAREDGGVTKLYYKQDDGTEVMLGGDPADIYPPSWKFDLDEPKAVSDTPDDEFGQGPAGLDPKWTVTDGASNPVNLLSNTAGRYDLTTRLGHLLVQHQNGDDVALRQDYTLPDAASIVFALAFTMPIQGQSGLLNSKLLLRCGLNDNDASAFAGNSCLLDVNQEADGWRISAYRTGGAQHVSTPRSEHGTPLAQKLYFRIARSGTTYYCFYSHTGETWQPMGAKAVGSVMNNVWIHCISTAAFNPAPIHAFHWIRQGTNAFDPW